MSSSLNLENHTQHPMRHVSLPGGLEYHYLERGEGRPLFFLHGFPDWAGTWDHALQEMSNTHRCIAPVLRGYYPTSIAPDGDYRMTSIAADIEALANALGIDTFDVVGHDWGASVTYALANLCPDRIGKIVTVAIPHPAFIKPGPVVLYKARHFLRFRNERKSLAYTKKNNFAYIDTLYQRWAPRWNDTTDVRTLMKAQYAIEGRLAAALGYYWSFHQTLGDSELQSFYQRHPSMPLLALYGETDGALVRKPFVQMQRQWADVRLVVHPQAGHFLHREAPEFFIDTIRSFFST